ncbi:hypothetical protein [Flavitalea sp.]|nr:hypothetical protein [Flavitalea sp.]
MSIPRRDLNFIFVVIAIMVILLIVRIHKENLIKNDKVFVAAIIKEVDWLENGFSYKCEYRYQDAWYPANFSDLRRKNDSLVLLEISTVQPSVWLLVEGKEVPKCFTRSNIPANGWKIFPTCPYDFAIEPRDIQ